MSYQQSYCHIIFSTKNRQPQIDEDREKDLYNYIWGILRNKNCHLYRIGGTSDHIHIFTSIHSTVCIADLVRDIKTSTNKWIRQNKVLDRFDGWQSEYAYFTKANRDRQVVIDYIKNQKEHHKNEDSLNELKRLLTEEGIDWDERYLH